MSYHALKLNKIYKSFFYIKINLFSSKEALSASQRQPDEKVFCSIADGGLLSSQDRTSVCNIGPCPEWSTYVFNSLKYKI